MIEHPAKSYSLRNARVPARTSDDPDFIGAEAALKRASNKALERARRAGLEPVILNSTALFKEALCREDPAPCEKVSHGQNKEPPAHPWLMTSSYSLLSSFNV